MKNSSPRQTACFLRIRHGLYVLDIVIGPGVFELDQVSVFGGIRGVCLAKTRFGDEGCQVPDLGLPPKPIFPGGKKCPGAHALLHSRDRTNYECSADTLLVLVFHDSLEMDRLEGSGS
jgi:hypothetical protein